MPTAETFLRGFRGGGIPAYCANKDCKSGCVCLGMRLLLQSLSWIGGDEWLLVGEALTVFYGRFLIVCGGFVEGFGDMGGFSIQEQDDC